MFFPNFYLKCSVIKQTIIYTMLQYRMDHIDSIKQFTYIILRNVMYNMFKYLDYFLVTVILVEMVCFLWMIPFVSYDMPQI